MHTKAANMNIDDDKPPLPMMIPNVVTAIVAGSDTASSVLACTIYYLLQHPDYLHRLQKELDAAFPPAEHPPIQLKELVNLELLNAIMFVYLSRLDLVPKLKSNFIVFQQ